MEGRLGILRQGSNGGKAKVVRLLTIEDCIREYLDNIEIHQELDRAAAKAESYLERMFWHYIGKTDVTRFSHIESQISFGRYRVDSLFTIADKKIVIEVDGLAYHDREADQRRDTDIFRTGQVDEIIRIQSFAVLHHDRSFMRVLEEWHDCFRVTQEVSTYNVTEWVQDLGTDFQWETTEEHIARRDSDVDIWNVNGNVGWVTSPLRFAKRLPPAFIIRRES